MTDNKYGDRKMKYLILLMLGLTACTTTYVKNPYNEEEFYRVSTQCQVMTRQAGAVNNFIDHSFMDRCMAGHGWHAQ